MTDTPHSAPLVVITGASQGIGAAIAESFANAGQAFRLALVARNRQALEAVAQRCSGAEAVTIHPLDVSDAAAVAALADQLGPVALLINNAGRWLGKSVTEMSPAEFQDIVDANLTGTFLMSKMVLPGMLAVGQGDIFTMASTAGIEGYAGVSAYCAAKHGVIGFCRALREEVRGKNIRVCTVSPGPTASPSWDGSGVAAERLMSTADVARVFLQLYQLDRNTVVEEMVLRPQAGHVTSD